MKKVVFIVLLLFAATASAKEKTSLLEATFYSGVPALAFSVAAWTPKIRKETTDQLWNNFTWGFKNPPIWDRNPWYVNYVGHPIFGSESYLLARNRDCSMFGSFLYSSAASVTWEYGIESWQGARPSIQDLLVTSTVGSLVGELRFVGKRALMASGNKSIATKILIAAIDPMDALYSIFE